jgi:hypothetical protein
MILAPDRLTATARPPAAEWATPNRWSSVVFGAKVLAYRGQRLLADLVSGPRRLAKTARAEFPATLGECHTPLWSDGRPAEHAYQLGKVQNLRRAAAALDGVLVPASQVFSFWKQIGRASRRRGFVTAACCSRVVSCRRPAAGSASYRTRSTRRRCKRDARLSSGTRIRGGSPAPPRRSAATPRLPGTMSICGSAHVIRCGSRRG